MKTVILETKRLYLRQWRSDDLPMFAQLNADPKVMAHFPKLLTRQESDAMAVRLQQLIADRGWGFWAVELKDSVEVTGKFIGFVGLNEPSLELPFAPCVEIGWRLHSDYWGKGYATEAAREALRFAFNELNLHEVVSFTALSNAPSQAVMRKLGMTNDRETFYHPAIESTHELAEHVLYRIDKKKWRQLNVTIDNTNTNENTKNNGKFA